MRHRYNRRLFQYIRQNKTNAHRQKTTEGKIQKNDEKWNRKKAHMNANIHEITMVT